MLLPQDDYPLHQTPLPLAHAMDGHPNAYDRFWFNGYDESRYFAVALGIYPNRGVIDAAFSVVTSGVQHSVFAGDQLHGRSTEVGPIQIEIVEPLRVNRIMVDAPDQGLRAELLYTRRTEAFEEPRQTMFDGSRIFMDVTRATQLGTWEGWIESPEGRWEIAAGTYGTKDRSWGIRPIGEPIPGAPSQRAPQLCFLWAPINFPSGAIHFMTFDDADGRALSRSAMTMALEGAGPLLRVDGEIVIEPLPGSRRARSATLTLGSDTVTLTPLFTFHMRGAGYAHPEFAHGRWHGGPYAAGETLVLADMDPLEYHNLHVQQVVRASLGGVEGLGVLETLIIGPYAPLGFTGLLDGAAN